MANIDPTGDVCPSQFAQAEEFRPGSVLTPPFDEIQNHGGNAVLVVFREWGGWGAPARSAPTARSVAGAAACASYRATGDLFGQDLSCSARRVAG